MLQRSCGTIPIDGDRSTDKELTRHRDISRKLTDLWGFLGGYNGVRKDKTQPLFFFLFYYARLRLLAETHPVPQPASDSRFALFRAVFLLHQWTQAPSKSSQSVTLIIATWRETTRAGNAKLGVGNQICDRRPKDLKTWPPFLHYIFDKSDPRAAKAVILSSYETFVGRQLLEMLIGVGDHQQLQPVVWLHKRKNPDDFIINEFFESMVKPLILCVQKAGTEEVPCLPSISDVLTAFIQAILPQQSSKWSRHCTLRTDPGHKRQLLIYKYWRNPINLTTIPRSPSRGSV